MAVKIALFWETKTFNFFFLFPLKIQQTTNYNNVLYIRKIEHESEPQRKTEHLPNLYLALPR